MLNQVRRTYAGTILGSAWVIIQPLFLMGAYVFLFTVLRAPKQLPGGAPALLGIVLSGLVPWFYFARAIPGALNAFIGHSALIRQINFPLAVVPFVTVGTQLIPFLVGVASLTILIVAAGWLSWATLLLVPAGAVMTLFLFAVATLVAPVGVMIRDLRALVPPVMRIAIFLTPVLYLPARVPHAVGFLPYVNPVSYFIGLVRYATFDRADVSVIGPWQDWGVALGVTAATVAVALANRDFARRHVVDHL